MSSIMRARSGLMGRGEPSEVMGLSRAEGCWTFDARDRMPRPSRATAHHLSEITPTATPAPLPRAGSFIGALQPVTEDAAYGRRCPKGDLHVACGRKSEGVSARPGPILGLAIIPEARPGFVHRRLPAAADPQRLAVLIWHRPGIAGDAGIGARRVDLEQIRE